MPKNQTPLQPLARRLRRRPSPANRWARKRSESSDPRRGSAMMIVMVLMGMLSILGVLFYTFAAQERSNAEYYSEAAKDLADPSLDADTLFDWALEQIIVGTDRRLTNSMLWGSRYSMLSNTLGFGLHQPGDIHPYNGEGLNLIFDTSGNIAVDRNRNGLPDNGGLGELDNSYLLDFVDTEAAPKNNSYDNGERQLLLVNPANNVPRFPQSDAGYTYPDINNLFLTYVSKVRDDNGNVHNIVKPAYHLPGLLRQPIGSVSAPLPIEDTNKNGVLDPGEDQNGNGYLDDWTINPNVAARVMRAHREHLFVPAGGLNGTKIRRYLTDAEATALIGPTARGFPFHPMAASYNTNTGGAGAVYNLGRMGPYSKIGGAAGGDDPIEFDYDNDGDNLPEAILMDLDFPAQQDALGNLFVPMYMITIHDQDGLFNLNVHGNLAKLLYGPGDVAIANTPISSSPSNPFGFNTTGTFSFVSKSNLGLSPSEINPLWGLNARFGFETTGTPFSQHRLFYNHPGFPNGSAPINPSEGPTWGETANMEFTWSKIGRLNFTSGQQIDDLLPGVYGEEGLLFSAYNQGTLSAPGGLSLPRPGIPLEDDNQDLNEGQGSFPYFQHPLDYKGEGTYVSNSNPKAINYPRPSGHNRWMKYVNYGDSNSFGLNGTIRWGQAGFMDFPITQGLGDDPNEIAHYADRRDIDNLFKPDEMLFLNSSNNEIDRLNLNSRLANLLPFNFAKNVSDNLRGDSIRRKFTVESNDRKSFGFPMSLTAGATASSISSRALGASGFNGNGQEYSFDTTTGTFKFPPQFGNIPRYVYTHLAEDPVRYATRSLLETQLPNPLTPGQQLTPSLQRKLSINQIITGDANSALAFRQLTPHPDDPGPSAISGVTNVTNYPPTTAAGQEYWARLDRQRMARDIYVLLYLLGHGNDTVNTATTTNAAPSLTTDGSTTYSEPQLREMAQFAVNLVDSMDRDSVITRFEYDKDLSDGWNLDDDPYGTIEATPYANTDTHYNPSYPNDSATRGEVYGVERLDLTLNESLVIQAKKSQNSMNYNQTNFDESMSDRFFFYTELLNHSPFPVTINPAKECWQIVLRQDASATGPAWERRLTLKDGSLSIAASTPPYVIGSTDASTSSAVFSRSTFAVDPAWAGMPTVRVAPPAADCNLDLIEVANPTSVFKIENEAGTDLTSTPGAMLSAFTGSSPVANMTGANAKLKVLLRRRAHPTRTTVDPADNPWVEVDSTILQLNHGFSVFDVGKTPTAAIATTQLKNAVSRERPQPLDGGSSEADSAGKAVATTLNTLGQDNSNVVAGAYNLWQLHFDRDYASVMDLLYVPLYGPHQITALTKGGFLESPFNQLSSNNPNSAVSNLNWSTGPSPGVPYTISAKTAASRFMVPEDPSNGSSSSPSRYLDNRWHRLLELLEVPTRTNVNMGVGTDLTIPRVPGKINLNTIRHPDVLAGLLDDIRLVNLNLTATPADPDAPTLSDQTGEAAREWWREFIKSRDVVDPYGASSGGVNVRLPGLPSVPGQVGGKPFRSLADVGYVATSAGVKHASVDDTILRSLPMDNSTLPSTTSSRRLFEIGNASESRSVASGSTVDPYIRNRLLSKIAGNTTTRSNVFGIFISVKYFQAVEQNGAIRIGGPLNGKYAPEHRGFFVVDRSKLESGQISPAPTYDFRAFIDYRKTLQTQ